MFSIRARINAAAAAVIALALAILASAQTYSVGYGSGPAPTPSYSVSSGPTYSVGYGSGPAPVPSFGVPTGPTYSVGNATPYYSPPPQTRAPTYSLSTTYPRKSGPSSYSNAPTYRLQTTYPTIPQTPPTPTPTYRLQATYPSYPQPALPTGPTYRSQPTYPAPSPVTPSPSPTYSTRWTPPPTPAVSQQSIGPIYYRSTLTGSTYLVQSGMVTPVFPSSVPANATVQQGPLTQADLKTRALTTNSTAYLNQTQGGSLQTEAAQPPLGFAWNPSLPPSYYQQQNREAIQAAKTLYSSPVGQGAKLTIDTAGCAGGVLAAPDTLGVSLDLTAYKCAQAAKAAWDLGQSVGNR